MSDWHALGRLTDFEADQPCGVELDLGEAERLPLVVVRRGDAHHVFLDRCPHRGARFSAIGCVDTEDEILLCGWHYWGFRLSDGGHTLLGGVSVPRYPSRVRDGQLEVDVAGVVL